MNRLIQILALAAGSAALSFCAADADLSTPPQTPPIPDIKIPNVTRLELPNGLRVLAVNDQRFPLVTVRLAFTVGSKFDPKDLPGLAAAVAELLNQGTTTRSATQIAIESAKLGGQITATAQADSMTVGGSCLSQNLPRFLALFADVARNSSFPEDEVALYKQNRTETLREQHSEPEYLADEALHHVMYGEHPYSHIGPTEASIKAMDRAAIVEFRDTYLAPNAAYLILVGRLPGARELQQSITDQFGAWTRKPLPDYRPPAFPANEKRFVLIDRPGSVQANVIASHLTPTYGSADYFPLTVSTRILGGGTNSRLFMDIREKRGFAYDAHTQTDFAKETGAVLAVTQVRNEVAQPAIEALNADLQAISKENVSSEELRDSKASFAGRFLLGLERQSGLADQLERVEIMGLPRDYLDTLMTRVRSVEPDQVRAAGKYWNPDDATVVVVGDAQKIKPALDKIGSFQVQPAPR